MAFTKVTDPTNNVSNLANQPVESPTALKAVFDEIGKDLKAYINNTLTVELESTTDGNSGLDNIGMTPIDGLTATTPQEALEELKALSPINIADGSIADVKLSNTAGQIKNVVATHTEQLSDIATNISEFPRIAPEADDTPRFIRAINFLATNGGGKLLLGIGEYIFDSGFNIPDNVHIIGQHSKSPWITTNVTLLTYTGESTFITVNSVYDRISSISNLNMRCTKNPIEYPNTIAIKIVDDANVWGGSSIIDKVSISNFGVGIRHIMTWQSTVKQTSIFRCGIGISYKSSNVGAAPSFGNCNSLDNVTIFECNVGMELASDILNHYRNTDIESCYIAVNMYALTGYLPPQQHRFENCWFEENGKKSPFDNSVVQPERYIFCNSEMDNTFLATGVNSVSMTAIELVNCREDLNVFPQIPNFNTDYEYWHVRNRATKSQIYTDDAMTTVFQKPRIDLYKIDINNSGSNRVPYRLSNQGLEVKDSLNGFTRVAEHSPSDAYRDITTFTDFAVLSNPDSTSTNLFSQSGLVSVMVERNNGEHGHAIFAFARLGLNQVIRAYKIGETLPTGLVAILIETTASAINVRVQGSRLQKTIVKINYLPNGLLI